MPADLILSPAPHSRPVTSVPQVMRTVLVALIPGLVAYVVSFGAGIVVNLAIAVAAAAATETFWMRLRGRSPLDALADLSAVVTGVLLTFALPPLLPWWVPAMAAATAIVLGKQIFGGLGANPFNPAMVGYVIVLISFPAEMLQWLPPRGTDLAALELSVIDHIVYALSGQLPAAIAVDAITQATPLDVARLGLGSMQTLGEIRVGPLFGQFAGAGWQLTNALVGCGGAYLLYRGIIRWQIPVAVIGGLLAPAAALYLFDTARFLPPTFHLLSGATMLGAFFIATDPVTAPGTPRGRLWYGAGIGLLVYAIRTWGGYPDGFAFAVLLMNAAVPLIDRYSRPRIYGHC
jgi:electron transport complex protein RnfD